MIGQKLSPILNKIEQTIWESESKTESPPNYTPYGFRSATKIFMSALMDKIWNLQEAENMPMEAREAMAFKCGEDIRQLVKKYTDIDTHSLYK